MKKAILVLATLLMPIFAHADYICQVAYQPMKNYSAYGNVGYLSIMHSPTSNCASQTSAFVMATGSNQSCGVAVDTNALYSEPTMMVMLEQLNQAKQAGRQVSISLYSQNTCQVEALFFN